MSDKKKETSAEKRKRLQKKARKGLGDGLAGRAADRLSGRQKQIDDILAAAEGTLQERDQPK